MNRQEASKKWWYRLLKVIFIICVLFSLIIPVLLFVTSKPVLNEYESRFSLKYDDGRVRGDFDNSDLNYGHTSFKNYGNSNFDQLNRMAKIACAYKETGDEFTKLIATENLTVPEEINYKIMVTKPVYYGSWLEAFAYTFLSLLGIIIFFSLIRAIFFYVFLDEKFWKTLIWNIKRR